MKHVAGQLLRSRNTKPAAIQFLFLLANAIARLCYQEFQLRQRINELTAVYNVTMMLADARDLNAGPAAHGASWSCDVMETKAAVAPADRRRAATSWSSRRSTTFSGST